MYICYVNARFSHKRSFYTMTSFEMDTKPQENNISYQTRVGNVTKPDITTVSFQHSGHSFIHNVLAGNLMNWQSILVILRYPFDVKCLVEACAATCWWWQVFIMTSPTSCSCGQVAMFRTSTFINSTCLKFCLVRDYSTTQPLFCFDSSVFFTITSVG